MLAGLSHQLFICLPDHDFFLYTRCYFSYEQRYDYKSIAIPHSQFGMYLTAILSYNQFELLEDDHDETMMQYGSDDEDHTGHNIGDDDE